MSEPTKKPEEGIVVGGKKNRMGVDVGGMGRRLVRPVFRLVVLAVIVAVGYLGWQYWSDHKSNNTPNKTKHVTAAQYTNSEIDKAKQQLADAKTPAEKAKAYKLLSNLYLNSTKGVSTSISYARKLVEVEPTADAYSQLAFALDQAGDYKGAADAYKQAAAKLGGNGAKNDGRSAYSYYLNAAKQEEAKL
jgi:hypothetical protein